MAFPGTAQFGAASGTAGAASASNYFPRQPTDYRMQWAPRRARGDGGMVQDGLDGVVLVWASMSQSDFAALTRHQGTAEGTAGIYYLRYWDETASSGAGAYAVRKGNPQPPDGGQVTGDYYFNVRWEWRNLGLP
jgi:hypothetical protein